ncbi:MAG: hypothetical protein ACJ763_09885, partial [Bdellovibrionia bacterium]
ILLLAGGISVALGIWADIGTLLIAAFVLPAALYFHRFWEVEEPNQRQITCLQHGSTPEKSLQRRT